MDKTYSELFDIYDEDGRPLGTASREDVHARGLWHRTFHCWLVRRDGQGGARVLFQRRSSSKDTCPDRYDITAAGHLTAGETPRDAVRELEEELGLRVAYEQLVLYGVIKEEGRGVANGRPFIDRETSHVYGHLTDRTPDAFRLQEEEVAGLYEADADALIGMMDGSGAAAVHAAGIRISGGTAEPHAVAVTRDAFVPRSPAYYADIFRFLRNLAARA